LCAISAKTKFSIQSRQTQSTLERKARQTSLTAYMTQNSAGLYSARRMTSNTHYGRSIKMKPLRRAILLPETSSTNDVPYASSFLINFSKRKTFNADQRESHVTRIQPTNCFSRIPPIRGLSTRNLGPC
jgi:hypothetical protein